MFPEENAREYPTITHETAMTPIANMVWEIMDVMFCLRSMPP